MDETMHVEPMAVKNLYIKWKIEVSSLEQWFFNTWDLKNAIQCARISTK